MTTTCWLVYYAGIKFDFIEYQFGDIKNNTCVQEFICTAQVYIFYLNGITVTNITSNYLLSTYSIAVKQKVLMCFLIRYS